MINTIGSIVILTNLVVFTAYIVYVLAKFGVPANLSITYYSFERARKGTGWLFPALMCFVCATTLPMWIYTTFHASHRAAVFGFLPIIVLVMLLAVAASGRYKKRPKLINFHYTCAIIAAACAMTWMCLVCYRIAYVGFICLLGFVLAGHFTNTLGKCTLFWLENAAFYSIFGSLFIVYTFAFPI